MMPPMVDRVNRLRQRQGSLPPGLDPFNGQVSSRLPNEFFIPPPPQPSAPASAQRSAPPPAPQVQGGPAPGQYAMSAVDAALGGSRPAGPAPLVSPRPRFDFPRYVAGPDPATMTAGATEWDPTKMADPPDERAAMGRNVAFRDGGSSPPPAPEIEPQRPPAPTPGTPPPPPAEVGPSQPPPAPTTAQEEYERMLKEGPKRSKWGTVGAAALGALYGGGRGYLRAAGRDVGPDDPNVGEALQNMATGGYYNKVARTGERAKVEAAAAKAALDKRQTNAQVKAYEANARESDARATQLGREPQHDYRKDFIVVPGVGVINAQTKEFAYKVPAKPTTTQDQAGLRLLEEASDPKTSPERRTEILEQLVTKQYRPQSRPTYKETDQGIVAIGPNNSVTPVTANGRVLRGKPGKQAQPKTPATKVEEGTGYQVEWSPQQNKWIYSTGPDGKPFKPQRPSQMAGMEFLGGQPAAPAAPAGPAAPAASTKYSVGQQVKLNGKMVTIKKINPDGTFEY